MSCADPSTLPVACPTDTYSEEGATTCLDCPQGFSCPSASSPPEACPPGSFSAAGDTVCSPCPAGSYCPTGAVDPIQCAPGSWSAGGETACQACNAGYFCAAGSSNPAPPGDRVAPGSYYNPGVDGLVQRLCPAGTYGAVTGGGSVEDACIVCPPGFYCLEGSTAAAQMPCPTGHFCPAGTDSPTRHPCASGTYNGATHADEATDCQLCPATMYCPAGTTTPVTCVAGYVCPEGTVDAFEHACPPGTWSSSTTLSNTGQCDACPPGSYCPSGSSAPTACPEGTFSNVTGLPGVHECQPCTAGMTCPTPGLLAPSGTCAVGHYCPPGTVMPTDYACPAGTFTDSTSLVRRLNCTTCPAGKFCSEGTGGEVDPPLPCFPGHYCPLGTAAGDQFECPPGWFTPATNLTAAAECTPCPSGSHCVGGQGLVSGSCAAGHYCPPTTVAATDFPCPAGSWSAATNLTTPEECTPCPIAHYCPSGSSEPLQCPPGSYTNVTSTAGAGPGAAWPLCTVCPGGYFCPEGSETPHECGAGFVSATNASTCGVCPAGYFCDGATVSRNTMDVSKVCPSGLFCPAGTAVVPSLGTHACPVGKYCPAGAEAPIPCAPGTHNEATGQAACTGCPPGSYCVEGAVAPTGLCDPGFYCPANSTAADQEPCPAGWHRATSGAAGVEECSVCSAGTECPGGTSDPAPCTQGFYCPEGTGVAIPCPIGTFGNTSGLTDVDACTPCSPGRYCDAPGLTTPAGLCDPGYFCTLGSFSPTPSFPGPPFLASEFEYGGVCPAGGYCPVGSWEPVPCPVGTFLNSSGQATADDCLTCTPGFYCASTAQPGPTGACFPGYYCDGGSETPTQHEAQPGYYTQEGDSAPIPCDPGTFNTETAQPSCRDCLPGYHCSGLATTTPELCGPGTYCPEGSDEPVPCPLGTFSSGSGLSNVTQCTPCTPGSYCSDTGLTAPVAECDAGFYCSGGAVFPAPLESETGDVCPAGHYCEAGSTGPMPCPAGTFSPELANTVVTDCLSCTPGYHCQTPGLPAETAVCGGGHYCSGGAITVRPFVGGNTTEEGVGGDICPLGHWCPEGSPEPRLCSNGTYANVTGLTECATCPPGFLCPGLATVNPLPCPEGAYCPEGRSTEVLCPLGTHNPASGAVDADGCLACPPGVFCEAFGTVTPTGNCTAGYWCSGGAVNEFGGVLGMEAGAPCPEGTYCPAGAPVPTQCPPGSYSPSLGNTRAADCVLCDAGSYCDDAGLTAVAGPCAAGYYCQRGVTGPTPSVGTTAATINAGLDVEEDVVVGGDICPPGFLCAEGTATPDPCEAGTFSALPGANGTCDTCPGGYYCPTNTSEFATNPCPPGYYCPPGTRYAEQSPCPNGTYNALSQRQSLSECVSCPAGQFCGGTANVLPDGNCTVGFYCSGGSASATPTDGPAGGGCTFGEYCPPGTALPRPCPGGSYCADNTGLPTGLCAAGYYCAQGAWSPTPSGETTLFGLVGDQCPPGHYCPEGSVSPLACPPGFFSPVVGATNATVCLPCTQGYQCPVAGIEAPSLACSPGLYCPTGTAAAQDACPAGSRCPEGSFQPEPCPAGTYQNDTQQASCLECPSRQYCPVGAAEPEACPAGHYCPPGTDAATRFPCPSGSFAGVGLLGNASECTPCTSGQFCETSGLTAPTGPCAAGHYCLGGSPVATPTDGFDTGYVCSVGAATPLGPPVVGDLCPPGHYCPPASTHPQGCPPGTFVSGYGSVNVSACVPCSPGYVCPDVATVVPTVECSAGNYCPGGQASTAEFPCPVGHYCPPGSVAPEPCAAGTHQNVTSQASCVACPARFACPPATSQPLVCPPGYVCTENTTAVHETPCLPGTASNTTGLASVEECPLCQSGMFCESPGLSAPTGPCAAGHYCAPGSIVAAPVSNSSGGVCPIGHVCPTGTGTPHPCPAGTYNNVTGGVDEASGCWPCPAGLICPNPGTHSPITPCPAGYSCPGGDASGTMSCTTGHFCDGGDAFPLPCPPGTWQATEGGSDCDACPLAHYCSGGTSEPVPCPPGHVCPEGTANAHDVPCPVGTWSNTTLLGNTSQCQPCLPGFYCGVEGIVTPDTPCGAGFYCGLGAAVPQPDAASGTGGPCSGGFVCFGGAGVPTPSGGASGRPCRPGTYCPEGSSGELGCPPGTYNPSDGASACTPCPLGRSCPGNGTDTEDCPLGAYCEEGSVFGVACLAGTYGQEVNLETAGGCAACPPGQYCVGGNVTGPCAAGYLCTAGAPRPDPSGVALERGTAGPCPPGHYCPEGTDIPVACPNGTVRAAVGGTSPDDCASCPAGYRCEEGNPVPIPCTVGHYCPTSTLETPCPPGTHNPFPLATNLTACGACPGGTLCVNPGTGKAFDFPCPAGYYCPPGATTALPCDAGTYNDVGLGGSPEDCQECPSGFTCGVATTAPEPCPPGTLCPPGSSAPTSCPAGSYCPPLTPEAITCPVLHFCGVNATQPTLCPDFTYCPAGSEVPLRCPLGYRALLDTTNTSRASLEGACRICPPGTFTQYPGDAECLPCTAGFVCSGGTRSPTPQGDADNGYPCPAGHYCPTGSALEVPCPPGTHNPFTVSANSSACLPCSAGSFQTDFGSSQCRPCSASSTSDPGAPTCECLGLGRVFQPSDGFCVCQPGMEFVDENFQRRSDEDGTQACQPIVYSYCLTNEQRDSDGTCVTGGDCSGCPSGSGTVIARTGLCECTNFEPLEEVCDDVCRQTAPRLTVNPSSGALVLTEVDPVTGNTIQTDLTTGDIEGFVGSLACVRPTGFVTEDTTAVVGVGVRGEALPADDGNCEVVLLLVAADSMSGVYDLTPSVAEAEGAAARRLAARGAPSLTRGLSPAAAHDAHVAARGVRRLTHGRRLQDTELVGSITSPVICLEASGSVMFDLPANSSSFPVYDKDSLLNTNPGFDFGDFRRVAELARSAADVRAFGYTFRDAGVHVFHVNTNTEAKVVVVVMAEAEACPTDGSISPMTEGTLIKLGVRQSEDLLVAPNWPVIIAVVAAVGTGLGLAVYGFAFLGEGGLWAWKPPAKTGSQQCRKAAAALPLAGRFGAKPGGGVTVNVVDDDSHLSLGLPNERSSTPGSSWTPVGAGPRWQAYTMDAPLSHPRGSPHGSPLGFARVTVAPPNPLRPDVSSLLAHCVDLLDAHRVEAWAAVSSAPLSSPVVFNALASLQQDAAGARDARAALLRLETAVAAAANGLRVALAPSPEDVTRRMLDERVKRHMWSGGSPTSDLLLEAGERLVRLVSALHARLGAHVAAADGKATTLQALWAVLAPAGANPLVVHSAKAWATARRQDAHAACNLQTGLGEVLQGLEAGVRGVVDALGVVTADLSAQSPMVVLAASPAGDVRTPVAVITPVASGRSKDGRVFRFDVVDGGSPLATGPKPKLSLTTLRETAQSHLLPAVAVLQAVLDDAWPVVGSAMRGFAETGAALDATGTDLAAHAAPAPQRHPVAPALSAEDLHAALASLEALVGRMEALGAAPPAVTASMPAAVQPAAKPALVDVAHTVLAAAAERAADSAPLREAQRRGEALDALGPHATEAAHVEALMEAEEEQARVAEAVAADRAKHQGVLEGQLVALMGTPSPLSTPVSLPTQADVAMRRLHNSAQAALQRQHVAQADALDAQLASFERQALLAVPTDVPGGVAAAIVAGAATPAEALLAAAQAMEAAIAGERAVLDDELAALADAEGKPMEAEAADVSARLAASRAAAVTAVRDATDAEIAAAASAAGKQTAVARGLQAETAALARADKEEEAALAALAARQGPARQALAGKRRRLVDAFHHRLQGHAARQHGDMQSALPGDAPACAGKVVAAHDRVLRQALDVEAAAQRVKDAHEEEVCALRDAMSAEWRRQRAALRRKLAMVRGKAVAGGNPGAVVAVAAEEVSVLEEALAAQEAAAMLDANRKLQQGLKEVRRDGAEDRLGLVVAGHAADDVNAGALVARLQRARTTKTAELDAKQDADQAAAGDQRAADEAIAAARGDATTEAHTMWKLDVVAAAKSSVSPAVTPATVLAVRADHDAERRRLEAAHEEQLAGLDADAVGGADEGVVLDVASSVEDVRKAFVVRLVHAAQPATEAEAELLKQQYEAETAALVAAKVGERGRQRERLASQLAARWEARQWALAQQQAREAARLAAAHARAPPGQSSRLAAEEAALRERHAGERARLDAEENRAAAAAMAQAEIIKDEFASDLDALQAATHSDRARQAARLVQQLAAKQEARLRATAAVQERERLTHAQRLRAEGCDSATREAALAALAEVHVAQLEEVEKEVAEVGDGVLREAEASLLAQRAAIAARVAHGSTEEEVEVLKREYAAEAAVLAAGLDDERRRQQARLQERLAAKRDAKMRALAAEQERERLAQAVRVGAGGDAEKAELAARHAVQAHAVEQDLAVEESEAVRVAGDAEAVLAARRRALTDRIDAMNVTNVEEVDLLKQEFAAEVEARDAAAHTDRARQQAKLQEKLAAKRAAKARALARKQELERLKLTAQHANVEAEAVAAVQAAADMRALQAVLKDKEGAAPEGVVAEAIEDVLRDRHTRETSELLARQYAERADCLRTLLEDVYDRLRADKAAVREAMVEAGEPQAAIDAELARLQAAADAEEAGVQANGLAGVEVRHAQELVALRQRQLSEVSSAFSQLAPTELLRRAEAQDAAAEAAKLEVFQSDLEREKADRLMKIQAEKEAFEEELRKQNEADLAKLEVEHEAQLAKERSRADAQLKARQERLREEADTMRREKLKEAAALDAATKDAVMKEFEEDRQRNEAALIAERKRQEETLRQSLAARKRARIAKKQARMEAELAAAAEEAAKHGGGTMGALAQFVRPVVLGYRAFKRAGRRAAARKNPSTTSLRLGAMVAAAKTGRGLAPPPVLSRSASNRSKLSGVARAVGRAVLALSPQSAKSRLAPSLGKPASKPIIKPLVATRSSVTTRSSIVRVRRSDARSVAAPDKSGVDAQQLVQRVTHLETMLTDLLKGVAARSSRPTPVVTTEASPRSRPPRPSPRAASPRHLPSGEAAPAAAALVGRAPPAAPRPEDGVLETVEPQELGSRQRLRLEFGRRLLRLCDMADMATGGVALAVAGSFPAPLPPKQTFRGQFYLAASRTLYVRRHVVEDNASAFALAFLHCLAALKAGDLSAEAAPAVVAQLNDFLHRCVGELFSAQTQSGAPPVVAPPGLTRMPSLSHDVAHFSEDNMKARLAALKSRVKSL